MNKIKWISILLILMLILFSCNKDNKEQIVSNSKMDEIIVEEWNNTIEEEKTTISKEKNIEKLTEEEKQQKIRDRLESFNFQKNNKVETQDDWINKIIKEEEEKRKIEEKEKKDKEMVVIKLIDNYISDIQSDKDVTLLLDDETIKFIKNQLQKTLNSLSMEQKEIFYSELIKTWYNKELIDFSDLDNIRHYINFIIKYPIKINWQIKDYDILNIVEEWDWEYKLNINIYFAKENKELLLKDILIKNNKIILSNY